MAIGYVTSDIRSNRFWGLLFKRCPEIRLDGVSIQHVTEADDERGFVSVEVHDENGYVLSDGGDVILTEKRHGAVEIIGDRR